MAEPKAVIADDEEQLRIFLKSKLDRLWPELIICGEAENGLEALEIIKRHKPQIAFLDIKMPGLSGLEVARRIRTPCRVVFITAYDQYAIEAFESEAIDYLLKPVTDERLAKTVKRLQKRIGLLPASSLNMANTFEQLLSAVKLKQAPEYLKWIKVRHGDKIRLIAVDEICYFKAADKYTLVRTHDGEALIKKSIRQLSEELDPGQFWRIHRGSIVNVSQIANANRSFAGRIILKLKDLPETLNVSRSYAHLFKQM